MSSELEKRLSREEIEGQLERTASLPTEIATTEDVSTPEERGISTRRLLIIVIGLCICMFLTALDQVSPSSKSN